MTPRLLSALAVLVSLAGGDRPHVVKDELPADFGAQVPYGLGVNPTGQVDAAAAALGRALFFDTRLSADGAVSCASCHLPAQGFADPRPTSVGVHGRRTSRNAPSLFNRGLGTSFFWDGRTATLEEQVLMPIVHEDEMGMTLDAVLDSLGRDPTLRERFGGAPTREKLARALAEFVRTIRIGQSPVDRFQGGAFEALSVEERLGLWVYESKGGCWRCHSGPNFSDEGFHNTGVGARAGVAEAGRKAVTGRDEDLGRFKTPTLRGAALSAPYMHDGSQASLEDVVEFYRQGGGANAALDEHMRQVEFSVEDGKNLVAFLKALSRQDVPAPR